MFSLQFTQYKPNILSISINKESLNIIKYVAGIGAHSSFSHCLPYLLLHQLEFRTWWESYYHSGEHKGTWNIVMIYSCHNTLQNWLQNNHDVNQISHYPHTSDISRTLVSNEIVDPYIRIY